MIRASLILAALCATPASAATVLHETWGQRSRGTVDHYAVTASEVQEAIGDSTIVGRFSFTNATAIGSGHSRSFTGSLFDHDTEIAFTIDVSTTRNSPGLVSDWWSVSADLPDGYRWGGADGWVDEQAIGALWIIRDPVAWVEPEQPAPVPLPGAGWLLACGLGALALRRAGR